MTLISWSLFNHGTNSIKWGGMLCQRMRQSSRGQLLFSTVVIRRTYLVVDPFRNI